MAISASLKRTLILVNGAYILGFAAYYVSIRNYEFLWYVAILIFFFSLILFTIEKSKFPPFILWGLSLWGLFHMAGGGVRIGEKVLYAQPLIHLFGEGESLVLKYDQVVHAFGFMMATFVVYHLLKKYLIPNSTHGVIYFVSACAGMGLGALNEIVEFIPVALGFQTGVGGYFNTAIDLVFNGLGALIAILVIHVRRKKKLAL